MIVRTTASPTFGVASDGLIVVDTSAAGETVTVAEAVLLVGSTSCCGPVTVAVFVIGPVVVARAVMWKVKEPPLASVPKASVPVPGT